MRGFPVFPSFHEGQQLAGHMVIKMDGLIGAVHFQQPEPACHAAAVDDKFHRHVTAGTPGVSQPKTVEKIATETVLVVEEIGLRVIVLKYAGGIAKVEGAVIEHGIEGDIANGAERRLRGGRLCSG